jgi:Ca-activated chloride channel homolog
MMLTAKRLSFWVVCGLVLVTAVACAPNQPTSQPTDPSTPNQPTSQPTDPSTPLATMPAELNQAEPEAPTSGEAVAQNAETVEREEAPPPSLDQGAPLTESDAAYATMPEQAPPLVMPIEPAPPSGLITEGYAPNPFIDTADDALSTFAIDVDTGSYSLMRRYLSDRFLPPQDSVRPEEYINYFAQEYPAPSDGRPFALHLEAAPAPYGESDRYHLLRVGVQGAELDPNLRPDALLIFVVDVSGSMERPERIGLLKESLNKLLDHLKPTDQVAIVTYGEQAQVWLPPTFVASDRAIRSQIELLQTGGGTNLEGGLALAYSLAAERAQAGQINQLILLSDGVANIGATTPELILRHAAQGIQLHSLGFGMGDYNDVLMEQLANQGDGMYAYVDTLEEAERVLGQELLGSLWTIAKDAKIQVMFNPAVVSRYRLIGYENRDIADEDFRNDAVDAGEIGAGHSVTALYEVLFHEEARPSEVALTVQLRYLNPNSNEPEEISQSLSRQDVLASFSQASLRFQLAATVAEFAELLRGSFWAQEGNMQVVAEEARRLARLLPEDTAVQEFAGLVGQAALLWQE